MKIIIDIPDGCYEELNNGQFPVQDAYRLVGWIKDGIPFLKQQADKEEQESVFVKIRDELIQSIQNGILKIESGNEELFSIIDKYRAESENREE